MTTSFVALRSRRSALFFAAMTALSILFLMIQPVGAIAVSSAPLLTTTPHRGDQLASHHYIKLAHAMTALNQGNYGVAYQGLTSAHEQDPANLIILLNLASLLEELGERTTRADLRPLLYAQSQQWYERIYSLTSQPDNVAFKIGRLAQEQTHYDEALGWYQRVLKHNPDNGIVHFNLANLYDATNQPKLAEAHFRKAIANDPKLVAAQNNLALMLVDQGRLAEAETCLKQALAVDKTYGHASLNLANLYLKQQRWELAHKQFVRILELQPKHPVAHIGAGNALFNLNRLEQACEHYRAVIREYPNEAQPYFLLAVANFKLQHLDEAMAAAEKYLALAPDGQHQASMIQLMQLAMASKNQANVPKS